MLAALLLAFGMPYSLLAASGEPIREEVRIHNPTDRPQVYLLDFDRWGYVDLYYTSPEGEQVVKHTGELVHPSKRDLSFGHAAVIEVEVPAKSTIEGHVILREGVYGGPLPLDSKWDQRPKEEIIDELWENRSFNLAIEAILLFIFAYNLGLYLTTRLRKYRLYLVLMIIMSLESARESGFLNFMMPVEEWWAAWQWYSTMVLNFFLCLLAPYLVRNLADLDLHFPRTRLVFKYYPYPAIFLLVMSMINPAWGFALFNMGIPFVFFLMFSIMVVNMVRRNPNSTMLFVGAGAMIIGSTVHWMGMSGLADLNEGVFSIFRSIGTIVFDTAMSFLLGKMLLDLKLENEQQQEQLIRNLRVEKRNQQRMAIAAAEAQEREREAIALRLHDDLQNQLVTLHFGLMNLEEDVKEEGKAAHAQVSGLVKESIRKVRHIAHEFMPPNLGGEEGLEQALKDLAGRVRTLGTPVDLHISGPLDLQLPMRAMVYRAVQELLSNSLKHSGADRIGIQLLRLEKLLSVTVEDNGVGFEESKVKAGRGLQAMEAGLMAQGGSLELKESLSGGARIKATFPLGDES